MRAHFLQNLNVEDNYILGGESLHHLVNVVRVEVNDELLLLNGRGLKVLTVIEEVSKKAIKLKKVSFTEEERKFDLDLALGMPKREALELSLKQATELGFRRVYLVKSDYSQMKFPESERTLKLLISALEQSNGAFLPEIVESTWDEIPYENYDDSLVFDSRPNSQQLSLEGKNTLLIVGPEGGFSSGEEIFFKEISNIKMLNVPTPIMRTPTAVAVGAGIVIRGLLK